MTIQPEKMRLYAVTDRAWAADEDAFFAQIADAIDGGASIVQLREKHVSDEKLLSLARRFTTMCREKGALSIINDRADIAALSGADGVHLGQEDGEIARARALLGPGKIIGVSAHNVEEALAAERSGADYLGSGAAFVTGTKPNAKPIGAETLRAVAAAVSIPVVAIGGVSRENITRLRGLGLAGVAVVSGLFAQRDVRAAAEELLRLAGTL